VNTWRELQPAVISFDNFLLNRNYWQEFYVKSNGTTVHISHSCCTPVTSLMATARREFFFNFKYARTLFVLSRETCNFKTGIV
jgi:hypothetical protein